MYSSNISVPHSYFKKAKKEYRDWMMALFREIIQNSFDAKATKIDFQLEENENDFVLTCKDNGSGMTEDILINVLLCLGGSHKDNPDAIGGFGYAKTLLFFSHDHYKVKTKNNLVEGVGGNYNFSKTDEKIKGTEITLTIAKINDREVVYEYEFHKSISEIMAYSHLKGVKVSFNDEIMKDNVYKFDYKHDTTIGTINFRDYNEGYSSKLWVRVNGLAMFQHHVWSNKKSCFLGILELNQDPIKVLTTNRDSLKGQAEVEFNQIFASLQDERSSLKTNKVMNWTLNEYNISFENERNKSNENDENTHEWQSTNQTNTVVEKTKEITHNSNNEPDPFEDKPETPEFSPFQKLVEATGKEKEKIEKLFQALDEEKLPINFKIQKDDSCSLSNHQIKKELLKISNIKMAHSWNKIIYSILASIAEARFFNINGEETTYNGQEGIFYYEKRPVYVGFIFGDNAKAVNSSNKNSITIMVNPALVKYNTKLSKLYDIGFHEATHIFTDNHDENFCSIEMNIKWDFRDYWNVSENRKFGTISFQ